jgi:hypothetical protein
LRGYATLLDELRQPIIDVPKVPSAAPHAAQPASFIFTSYWASFKQYKLDNREWKADTAENAEGTKNIFNRLVPGTTTAQFVSAPIASDFKSKLMLLPRNYAQGDQKKKSAEKLIALGRTLHATGAAARCAACAAPSKLFCGSASCAPRGTDHVQRNRRAVETDTAATTRGRCRDRRDCRGQRATRLYTPTKIAIHLRRQSTGPTG